MNEFLEEVFEHELRRRLCSELGASYSIGADAFHLRGGTPLDVEAVLDRCRTSSVISTLR